MERKYDEWRRIFDMMMTKMIVNMVFSKIRYLAKMIFYYIACM